MTTREGERDPGGTSFPSLRSPWEVLFGRSPWLNLAALLLLHLTNPILWVEKMPAWWFPPVGLGIVLVAWWGWRGAVLVMIDTILVGIQAELNGLPGAWAQGAWLAAGRITWDTLLMGMEVVVAWGCYHQAAQGTRRLGDPRSAILFLIVVPGLVAAAFAVPRAVPIWLSEPEQAMDLGGLIRGFWLSDALGILIVAPPLLATLTSWLVRRGLALPDPPLHPSDEETEQEATSGDAFEIAGLAIGMGFLGLLQALIYLHPDIAHSQLWGLPYVVVVLVSLHQGLRGGTVVAASAVGLPLLLLGRQPPGPDPIMQGNFLALCCTALLSAAAANWIRLSEARYRQVVTRIPVVLCSARVISPSPRDGAPPAVEMIFVSPASLDLLGAHPIELLGDHRRWLSRVHPDDQEVLLAAVARLTRQREPVACEYRIASLESGPPLGPDDPVHSTRSALRGALAPPGSKRPSGLIPRRHPRWVRHTLAPQYSPAGELVGWDGIVSDITEQRVLADDLRRTTTMFDALVANLPAGVFFVQGEAGLPILLNARARQLLGQAEQLDVGLNRLVEVYRLHRPDGSPYPTDELPVVTALRSGTTSMRDDIVVHRPDGGLVPLITWAAPIHLGGEGRPDAAVWVFEDLTALKQAEAARRESEARLRTVIETMAEGVIILDERSVILECNPAACAILGRDAAGLRGRSLLEPEWQGLQEDGTPLPPEEHPAVVSRRLGRAVRNVIMGLTGTAAGAVRWLLASAVPLPRETGPGLAQPTPVRRVLMTFADITAYRQALDTVRASEEKNRVLVETLPIMLVQFDRGGQLTYMNPAAQRVSGYGPEDLQGAAAWETLIHPDDLPAAREAFAKALAEDTVRFEIRYWAKDGSEKVGYVLMEPRYHDGQVAGTTHLIVDMTRERQLEQELQRTQRLELIGRLASGMTHDFNNLLTVILTLAELARTSLPDDHPVRDDLHRIALAGEQAANLAHQLLAFCKNRRATPHRIDVNRVARRALELLQATLPRSIHIEPQLAQEELPILADEMQLQQVLINLCLNARDAMPHGGRLILRSERAAPPRHSVQAASGNGSGSGHDAERTTASGNGEGESALWVRLAVEDEGHGIPDDVRARIFDPFFSTKEHGTGLGLAMVRQIVEGCGGWVEVWSRPGEGSRFDVWLPPAPADEPAPVPGKVMV